MKTTDYREQRISLALISGFIGAVAGIVVAIFMADLGPLAVVFFLLTFFVVTLGYAGIEIVTSDALSQMRSWAYGPNGPTWLIEHQITLSAFWPATHPVLFTWYAMTRFIVDWHHLEEGKAHEQQYAAQERVQATR